MSADAGTGTGRSPWTALAPAVRLHMGLGELALRLFLLHLLWLAGTLAGGVLLGIGPATAAVHAVLRRDRMDRRLEELDRPVPSRARLGREFWTHWRAGLLPANLLAAVLGAGWAVIAVDRWVLGPGIGAATPWLSGVVVALTVVLALLSAVVWPLQAHFSDPLPRLLRMALVLLLARPLRTLAVAGVLAATIAVWGAVPGLVPVFGIVLPAWAITAIYWRAGVLATE
ncbi:YesL family protein [Brachybacterium sp. DNPG3]